MGRDKAMLPFGPELILQRVVRLVDEVVAPENTVVVAARDQWLPTLPPSLLIMRDVEEHRGPLSGLAIGLRALADRADAVYVTGCDAPLLMPAIVARLFDLLGDHDAAVPFDVEHYHSLAAVYRPSVLPHIEAMLETQQMQVRLLFSKIRAREIPVDELRNIDPQLQSLENINWEQDYLAALNAAGFALSPERS